MFGSQTVGSRVCIGALVFCVCGFGHTIPLALGVFGGQSRVLRYCTGALLFSVYAL